ncbi:pyridoxamine 5'-phosphate oxidase family protein [Alicyclobacillus fastidiosus]|uniref:Pyridoxamine 5'-phosphate oxidase family protein n=2 Tax=Alicyclobacillus fastidiosus TaxID=392011 RepID=A0ABY6ZPN5_9BACL|nr:pyridoxamine 5'-phosphate oxidase family protein [Alicyclobacillus fastidiosus]WAH44553.1 pyridoxamine 5'-phosphate oxidase family protein [Alicyclobacillus fastidiosus]
MNITTDGIRKQNLAITDATAVDHLLRTSRVGYLGLVDGDEPYVVPLNFVWHSDSIYVHGAQYGRKANLMSNSPKATFTVADEVGTIAHPVPAKTDTAYLSAMVFGKIAVVEDFDEATSALEAMLCKYVPGYYDTPLHSGHVRSYVSGAGSHVAVYRLRGEKITAKENPNQMSMMFYPGRTRKADLQHDQK